MPGPDPGASMKNRMPDAGPNKFSTNSGENFFGIKPQNKLLYPVGDKSHKSNINLRSFHMNPNKFANKQNVRQNPLYNNEEFSNNYVNYRNIPNRNKPINYASITKTIKSPNFYNNKRLGQIKRYNKFMTNKKVLETNFTDNELHEYALQYAHSVGYDDSDPDPDYNNSHA